MSATPMPAPTRAPNASNEASDRKENQPEVKRRGIVLRGFIRRAKDGSGYEGICLTLNLPVRGRSIEEADEKLRDLIVAYLRDVARDGAWDEFVPRRAPLSYYAAYYWYSLLATMHAINDFKLFVESAPNCMAHA
jgi:hypothetical protein